MMRFSTNSYEKESTNSYDKGIIKILLAGFITYSVLGFLIGFALSKDTHTVIIVVVLFLIFLFVAAMFGIPSFNQAYKLNRAISAISVDGESVAFTTTKIVWLKKREFKTTTENIKCWVSKDLPIYLEKKEGIFLRFGSEDYYIIEDYFDDYNKLKKVLIK